MLIKKKDLKLSIIGLGYVGLPLALEFAKKRKVIAFDINEIRVKDLKNGKDINREFKKHEIQKNLSINFTNKKVFPWSGPDIVKNSMRDLALCLPHFVCTQQYGYGGSTGFITNVL